MLDADPRNAEVIFPYLNGEDLNTHPEQHPSRWVINFWDWPEERAAEYRKPFDRVRRLVKPEREELNQNTADGRRRKRYWWLYGRDAKALYHAIGRGHGFVNHPEDWDPTSLPLKKIMVLSRVSKTGAFVFVPNEMVASEATVVFASEQSLLFAQLQSSIHVAFASRP